VCVALCFDIIIIFQSLSKSLLLYVVSINLIKLV
jgi:hypothetical protein